jgi:hypothetical protein
MADAQEQQQHRQGRKKGAGDNAVQEASPEATPGLDAVRAITAQGDAAAASVVRVMREHPTERDEIMTWLHQHRGNAFVQQVTSKMGVIERAMPEGVDLKAVTASVTIPAGKTLAGDWASKVATKQATTLTVEVSQTGIRAWLSPYLQVDATWPLQNAEIRGAGVRFADGKPYSNVADTHGLGSGMLSITDKLDSKLTGIIAGGIAGTPLAQPGYHPTQDTNLAGTLDKVVHGFGHMFDDDKDGDGKPDHGDKNRKPALEAREVGQVSAGATVTTKAGGSFVKDGAGLELAPGSDLTMTVEGGGNLHDVMGAHSPAAAAQAASVRAVRLNATGMKVVAKGKPVAQITAMTLHHGGSVTIDSMQLLGTAKDARVMEQGLSLIVGLIAMAGRDGNAASGAMNNAQNPQIVDGVARAVIEKTFNETVHDMVIQHRAAVPGVDLAKVLGIG